MKQFQKLSHKPYAQVFINHFRLGMFPRILFSVPACYRQGIL